MADLFGVLKKLSDDPALLTKIQATKTPQDIVDLAKSEGVDINLNEVVKALSEKEKYQGLIDHLTHHE